MMQHVLFDLQHVLFDFALQAAYQTPCHTESSPLYPLRCPEVEPTEGWTQGELTTKRYLKSSTHCFNKTRLTLCSKQAGTSIIELLLTFFDTAPEAVAHNKSRGFASQFFEQRTSWCQQGHSGCFEGDIGDAQDHGTSAMRVMLVDVNVFWILRGEQPSEVCSFNMSMCNACISAHCFTSHSPVPLVRRGSQELATRSCQQKLAMRSARFCFNGRG